MFHKVSINIGKIHVINNNNNSKYNSRINNSNSPDPKIREVTNQDRSARLWAVLTTPT